MDDWLHIERKPLAGVVWRVLDNKPGVKLQYKGVMTSCGEVSDQYITAWALKISAGEEMLLADDTSV